MSGGVGEWTPGPPPLAGSLGKEPVEVVALVAEEAGGSCVDVASGCAFHGAPPCRSPKAYKGDWAKTVAGHSLAGGRVEGG